jgi:hypothetical protein
MRSAKWALIVSVALVSMVASEFSLHVENGRLALGISINTAEADENRRVARRTARRTTRRND